MTAAMERLEKRALLTVTVSHTGAFVPHDEDSVADYDVLRTGYVTITGDANPNNVEIHSLTPGKFTVYLVNERRAIVFNDPNGLTHGIRFYGSGGNDIYLNETSLKDIEVDGGAGADELYGGFGRSTIMGGADNDWIYLRTTVAPDGGYLSVAYGDGGMDHIFGSIRRDILIGGGDSDYLDAGDGDDFLSGGLGGDILLGGGGVDTMDGGYDGFVDLMSGGLESDLYRLHVLPNQQVESDATINDGTDRFELMTHTAQPVRNGMLEEFGDFTPEELAEFDGVAWMSPLDASDPALIDIPLLPEITEEDLTGMLAIDDVFSSDDLEPGSMIEFLEPPLSLFSTEQETAIGGYHEEDLPVDRSETLDADEALIVDVSVTDTDIGSYEEAPSLLPILPPLLTSQSWFSIARAWSW